MVVYKSSLHGAFGLVQAAFALFFRFFRTRPAFYGYLFGARHDQFAGFAVLGNHAARAGGGLVAHGDGRHQRGVRADAHFVADNGTVLVHAVIIAGNRACADIGVRADGRITDIRQMVRFAAAPDGAVFHFHEIADVHVVRQFGIRAQARIRADVRMAAHGAVFQMRKRMDNRARADDCIFNHAVRADGDAVAQHHAAFQNAVRVNHHVFAVLQAAPDVEAWRIQQCYARQQQLCGAVLAVNLRQFGQL